MLFSSSSVNGNYFNDIVVFYEYKIFHFQYVSSFNDNDNLIFPAFFSVTLLFVPNERGMLPVILSVSLIR